MSEHSSVSHAGSVRATLRKGKFEQFQKTAPHRSPPVYTLANNKPNSLPTAYHIYIIIRIVLKDEDSLACRGFPLEGKYIYNITFLRPRLPI